MPRARDVGWQGQQVGGNQADGGDIGAKHLSILGNADGHVRYGDVGRSKAEFVDHGSRAVGVERESSPTHQSFQRAASGGVQAAMGQPWWHRDSPAEQGGTPGEHDPYPLCRRP